VVFADQLGVRSGQSSPAARAGRSVISYAPAPGYCPSLTFTVVCDPSDVTMPTLTVWPGFAVASASATSVGLDTD
jgi:hypothetical protein